MEPLPPRSTLFPYTTLFRSQPTTSPGGALEDERSRVSLRFRRLTDRKSTRLNSSHRCISYAVFCVKKKKREVLKTEPIARMVVGTNVGTNIDHAERLCS